MNLVAILGPFGTLLFVYLVVVSISALAIWITGKLGLGLAVSGLYAALIASLAIVILRLVIGFVLELLGLPVDAWWLQLLVNIASAFIVILAAGRVGKDFRVSSSRGAWVAAVAVALLTWLIGAILIPS